MNILIIDNDNVSIELLKQTLENTEHEFFIADNEPGALERFSSSDIKMILVNQKIAGLNILSFCRKIRENPGKKYACIVVMVSKERDEDIKEIINAGADDFIHKPLQPDEIMFRIKSAEHIVMLDQGHKFLQDVVIESKNKIITVFDALTQIIISVDKELKILSANKPFINEINMPFDRVIGCNLVAILSGIELKSKYGDIPLIAKKTIESGEFSLNIFDCFNRNGDMRKKEVAFIPVKKNGKTLQVVISCRDITEELLKTEKINRLNIELNNAISEINSKNKDLEETLKRLKNTQAQILQTEKMSSIGQLAAGVAHEINNPTGFVSSNLKSLADYYEAISRLLVKYREILSLLEESNILNDKKDAVASMLEEIRQMEEEMDIEYVLSDVNALIRESRDGTDRIRKIVQDLKDFAHPGDDKLKFADINRNIESTLNIVWNELKYKATVTKEFGNLPQVECYPHQLNQVFMNILVNAAQAIEKKGEIKIVTEFIDNNVRISISDTGSGINKENIPKIFDPFFTTKEVGKGTGLGLNVAYNIIKNHKGSIDVKSEPDQGTTFNISIPVEQN
jgi:two-component system, NtrC family, sensor kinase